MFEKSITKEEIEKLPLIAFDGQIIEIENISDTKNASKYLAKQNLLGFDTETKPNFKKGGKNNVALLQLSTEEYSFLFKLKKTGIPDSLAKILSDENIIKVGVALKDDLTGLKKYSDFKQNGFVELQSYVKNFGIEDMGLKKLTAIILGYKISKSQQVTNWESDKLTSAQKTYAATDAWICQKIFKKLNENQESNSI
jgi:ribonuclease D